MEKTIYDSRNDTIYAKGNSVNVMESEVQQAVSFYEISGLTEQEAQKQGIEYAYERKALYQEAVDKGYQVTEAEIRAYLDELRDILESDGGSEEYEMIKSQFDSDEDYWEYEYAVYTIDLPIQKYVADLEKDYYEKNDDEEIDIQDAWIEYFENYKNELVEKENFQKQSRLF